MTDQSNATAHIVYQAIDPAAPCTTSALVISRIIRGAIGFQGLLLSDDLSMKALEGGLADRARSALAAGCDIVLHCNGDLAEMRSVAEGAGVLTADAQARADAALARSCGPIEPLNEWAEAEFDAMLAGSWP